MSPSASRLSQGDGAADPRDARSGPASTVIFSNIRADLLKHRHHYVANWRAASGRTVWVDSLGSRNPHLRDLARLGGERAGQNGTQLMPRVTICAPGAIPFHGSKTIYRVNARTLERRLRRLEVDPDQTVAWVYLAHPSVLRILERHRWQRVLFDLCDDIADFRGIHSQVHAAERELLLKADVVVASSTTLVEKAVAARGPRNVSYIPNGVDSARFAHIKAWSGTVKTLLYIGSVFEWFDARLVAEVAARRPDLRFRIVGPIRRRLSDLRAMPNVDVVGPVAADDVPRELDNCDLMMIPFRSGPLATATDPLKVYEALAAGRPVLATDLPQVRRFSPAVRVAKTAMEWTHALCDLESGEWNPDLDTWRAVVGRSEDWRCRFDELAAILDERASR